MKKMLLALSLSGALLGGSAAWAENAASAPATEETTTVVATTTEAPVTGSAEAPSAATATPAPAATPKMDSGDTAWILISTALVLLMTIPGLALFYGGMVRKKNVLSTMAHSFGRCCNCQYCLGGDWLYLGI
ncbi:hypothetical protein QE384_002234 [Acinetobacter baylyi]|nr:hypothetical protein [Acinetobacter baylyi]